jgi:hypothetical protein
VDSLQNAGIGNLLHFTFNENAHFIRCSVWDVTEIHSPFSTPGFYQWSRLLLDGWRKVRIALKIPVAGSKRVIGLTNVM